MHLTTWLKLFFNDKFNDKLWVFTKYYINFKILGNNVAKILKLYNYLWNQRMPACFQSEVDFGRYLQILWKKSIIDLIDWFVYIIMLRERWEKRAKVSFFADQSHSRLQCSYFQRCKNSHFETKKKYIYIQLKHMRLVFIFKKNSLHTPIINYSVKCCRKI